MVFQLNKTLAADSFLIGQFELSDLLLMNDSQFPWFTLVPRRQAISEIYQLGRADQKRLWQESEILSKVIMDYFNGEKLNVAAIGNIVSQLHLHHVVRFRQDACWPKPIWGQLPMVDYSESEAKTLVSKISDRLERDGFSPLI